jgi:hypothetical protein
MIDEVLWFSSQFSQDGFPTFDSITDCDFYSRPNGEKRIHSRPKSNQAESFTADRPISRRDPTDNPSGDQSSHLHTEHLRILRRPNHQSILLVPQRRIRLTGNQKQTWLVLYILYDPFTGQPVNVHVEYVQEDADPDTASLNESGLELFLDGDDFPVTRRHDDTRPLRDHAGGIAEEPGDEERQDCRPDRHKGPSQPSC